MKLTLRKLSRAKGNLQKQEKPLTRNLLERLLEHCDLNTVRGIRDAVLLNLGYETMRRRSELVKFRFEDIRVSVSGEYGILLRHSKTDQNGNGRVIPISHKLTDQLDKWQLRVQDSGYILRNINRAEAIGEKLSGESINRILKRLEKEAGSQDSKLSGHSFRVGRTIELVGSGCSTAQIALLGGWKSEKIVMRYSEAWARKSG